MKVSVVIPVYNERETVEELVSKVKSVELGKIDKEIILVDDFSTDGTREILKTIDGIKTIFHKKNLGKGGALKSGIAECSGDIIIVQDADLEYSPSDYPALVAPIVRGEAKVVYGSRLLSGKNVRGKWWCYLGGIVVTKFTNLLYGSRLTDMWTCYKVIHKDLKPILLGAGGNRFDWELEVGVKILRKGYKIKEVPISYDARSKEGGKKIGVKDGVYALWTLLKWRFKKID